VLGKRILCAFFWVGSAGKQGGFKDGRTVFGREVVEGGSGSHGAALLVVGGTGEGGLVFDNPGVDERLGSCDASCYGLAFEFYSCLEEGAGCLHIWRLTNVELQN
jgi:hypothetical protein